ncbi:MAG: hypothetical protein QME40_08025, partial [bacterium]|nr:hypothetical protein [bacterium]
QERYSFDPAEWKNQDLIHYLDHGSLIWAGIYSGDIPLLTNSLVLNDACSTCECESYYAKSFCVMALRRGGIGHAGAVSVAWGGNHMYMHILNGIYYDSLSLGQAFSRAYTQEGAIPNYWMTTFLGDPTLELKPPYLLTNPLDF